MHPGDACVPFTPAEQVGCQPTGMCLTCNCMCFAACGSDPRIGPAANPAARDRRACAGFGGRVAQQLAQHSIRTAADLQQVAAPALRALCPSLSEQAAATLLGYARGVDPQLPHVRPPPKALSLQMTLTPVPLPMHPSATGPSAAAAPAGAGAQDDRMLMPLHLLAPDAGTRMRGLLRVMLRDLLGRVWQDRYKPLL